MHQLPKQLLRVSILVCCLGTCILNITRAAEFDVGDFLPGYRKGKEQREVVETLIVAGDYDSALFLLDTITSTTHFTHHNSEYKQEMRPVIAFLQSHDACRELEAKDSTAVDTLCACFEETRVLTEELPQKLHVGRPVFELIDSVGRCVYRARNDYCIRKRDE